MLGHADIKTAMKYVHAADYEIAETLELFGRRSASKRKTRAKGSKVSKLAAVRS